MYFYSNGLFQSLAAMKRQQGIATTTMAVRQSIQDNELVNFDSHLKDNVLIDHCWLVENRSLQEHVASTDLPYIEYDSAQLHHLECE